MVALILPQKVKVLYVARNNALGVSAKNTKISTMKHGLTLTKYLVIKPIANVQKSSNVSC